ncbi:MAG: HAD family hydrolase [Pseudomonadota bacterium]
MWSGPRNMSTTMMRSFGSRPDTMCIDEPFYAAYLKASGLVHPMQDEIMASQSSDPSVVANQMRASDPDHAIIYQKHMTHHMVDALPRDWMSEVTNVFLIRHPARVLRSYARKMETVSLEATGFPQQFSLYEHARQQSGQPPIVIDSDTILADPPAALKRLCQALQIEWDNRMLSWTAGPKPEDGAWARHWYDSVWASTRFGPPAKDLPTLSPDLQTLCDEAMSMYEKLKETAI